MTESSQADSDPSGHRTIRSVWRRHYALPGEHGSWIWLLGPMVVGTAAARQLSFDLIPLALAALAAFLLRQPATLAVKALSGRRSRQDLQPALAWIAAYLLLGGLGLGWLLRLGHGRLLALALPGLPVFAWHLWLVRRRQERRQPGVEIVAAGTLALAAPAAYWTAGGGSDRVGWTLWLLTWLQAAASIVYVHLRLEQRGWAQLPSRADRWRRGARALGYAAFNLCASTALASLGWAPTLAPMAFGLALADTAEGVGRPAITKPARAIGLRQLASSTAFVLLLALAYLL
jgi:hypothetical protein